MPSIKKNYLYRLSYEVLILILPFITTPYVSRVLGADGIGIYSYTSSVMTYFTLFAALGTVSYGTREISQHRDNRQESSKIFWEIELMTIATSSVCLLIWLFVILFSAEYRYYYMALVPMLLATMADISWYFMGHEKIKYIVIRNTLCKIFGMILLFAFVRKKEDLFLYVLINSAIQLAGNLTMWSYLPGMLVAVDFKTLTFKRHFHETVIYFIPAIATSVYTVLDKTLIGVITENSYQNGFYEQATRIMNMIKSIVFTSVNAVMGARISYLFSEEKYDEIRRRIVRSLDFILLIGTGCAFGVCGIASVFVPFFLGEGYEPVICLLYLMSPLILIIGISNCLGSQYYTPSGQRKKSARIIVFGSVVNLCFNLLLIPKYGANGATVGSLIAETAITVLYVQMSNTYMTWKIIWKCLWKRLLAGGIMCMGVIMIKEVLDFNSVFVLGIQMAFGAGIYFILLLMMRDSLLAELLLMLKK